MSKLSKTDMEAIKDTIKHTGEVRFHIIYSKSNLTVKCRLWHHDDKHVLGVAHGWGYDRAGAALGQAIEVLFPEELKALSPRWDYGKLGALQQDKNGIYGLSRGNDGTMILDGACGIEQMLTVLRALGFTSTELYETSKSTSMVLARKGRG